MAASAKLTIRLTHEEARVIRSQALRLGLSLSAFARHQILHGGRTDATAAEGIVSQILPVIEARIDGLADRLESIQSEARGAEERTSDRLKRAVQIVVDEVRKK